MTIADTNPMNRLTSALLAPVSSCVAIAQFSLILGTLVRVLVVRVIISGLVAGGGFARS